MRPPILFPLFAEVSSLQGIGPRYAKLIGKLTGPRLVDLIWHKPFSVHDWSHEATVATVKESEPVSIALTIVEHRPSRRPGLPYKIMASDPTGYIDLVFFKSHGDYLMTLLPVGALRHVRGKAERYDGRLQMTHPDAMMDEKAFQGASKFEPVYPGTEGLPQKTLARAIAHAVDRIPVLEEWQDPAWLKQQGWPDWNTAIKSVHAPRSLADIDPQTPARRRLAYDELLASQLALNLARTRMREVRGRALKGDGVLRAKALAALKFRLTGSQDKALDEIFTDMASRPLPTRTDAAARARARARADAPRGGGERPARVAFARPCPSRCRKDPSSAPATAWCAASRWGAWARCTRCSTSRRSAASRSR